MFLEHMDLQYRKITPNLKIENIEICWNKFVGLKLYLVFTAYRESKWLPYESICPNSFNLRIYSLKDVVMFASNPKTTQWNIYL